VCVSLFDRGGGNDEGATGVFSYGEGLVEGPGEAIEVGGIGRGWCSFLGNGEGDGPWVFTNAEHHNGRRQLDLPRTRAAMSGNFAAMARASG